MRLNQRLSYAHALRAPVPSASSPAGRAPIRAPHKAVNRKLGMSSSGTDAGESSMFLSASRQSEGVLHRVRRWESGRLNLDGITAPLHLPQASRARQSLFDLQPAMHPTSLANGPVVYIDGETTGLGGTSNRFCVIGIVYATAQAWVCEQWVLAKLSYEAEFLRAVTARLDALDPSAIVSFNGASFDLPLFRKRLLAQKDSALASWKGLCQKVRPHVDLVHAARRVWKGRVPDCRLQTLERHYLGVHRINDLPGKEVPKVYWAWLTRNRAAKEAKRMEEVLLHNLVDLAVMPVLAHRIAEKLADPQDGEDALRALCHCERAPSHPIFVRAMQRWLAAGQPGLLALREPRLQVWVRALEQEQARNTDAASLLHKLLGSARRRCPSSTWISRRCARWGLLQDSSSARAVGKAQLALSWGV